MTQILLWTFFIASNGQFKPVISAPTYATREACQSALTTAGKPGYMCWPIATRGTQ